MRIDRVKFIAEMARQELIVSQLAEKAGVSRCTVTAIRGGKRCSKRTAEKVASALGVDVAAIAEVK